MITKRLKLTEHLWSKRNISLQNVSVHHILGRSFFIDNVRVFFFKIARKTLSILTFCPRKNPILRPFVGFHKKTLNFFLLRSILNYVLLWCLPKSCLLFMPPMSFLCLFLRNRTFTNPKAYKIMFYSSQWSFAFFVHLHDAFHHPLPCTSATEFWFPIFLLPISLTLSWCCMEKPDFSRFWKPLMDHRTSWSAQHYLQ